MSEVAAAEGAMRRCGLPVRARALWLRFGCQLLRDVRGRSPEPGSVAREVMGRALSGLAVTDLGRQWLNQAGRVCPAHRKAEGARSAWAPPPRLVSVSKRPLRLPAVQQGEKPSLAVVRKVYRVFP